MSRVKAIVDELEAAIEVVAARYEITARQDTYAAVLYLELASYGHVRPDTLAKADRAQKNTQVDLDVVLALLYEAYSRYFLIRSSYYRECLDLVKEYVLCG